jgi:hypothetical protein
LLIIPTLNTGYEFLCTICYNTLTARMSLKTTIHRYLYIISENYPQENKIHKHTRDTVEIIEKYNSVGTFQTEITRYILFYLFLDTLEGTQTKTNFKLYL